MDKQRVDSDVFKLLAKPVQKGLSELGFPEPLSPQNAFF
jgi:hypothetical protein